MSWQKCLHVKRCWVRKLSFKIFKTIFQPQHTLRGFSLSRTKTSLILSRFFPPARLAAEVAAKVINQSDILNSSPSHDDIKWLTWKLLLFHAHYSNCLKHFFPLSRFYPAYISGHFIECAIFSAFFTIYLQLNHREMERTLSNRKII